MIRSAQFSTDRSMRFELVRILGAPTSRGLINFIGLNPSDADENKDDMTARKGVGFAGRWGYDGFVMTNLVPVVSTDPWQLPYWHGRFFENESYLEAHIKESALVVLAWGVVPRRIYSNVALGEHIAVVRSLLEKHHRPAVCIGLTKTGSPLHPSRTAYTLAPVPYDFPERAA